MVVLALTVRSPPINASRISQWKNWWRSLVIHTSKRMAFRLFATELKLQSDGSCSFLQKFTFGQQQRLMAICSVALSEAARSLQDNLRRELRHGHFFSSSTNISVKFTLKGLCKDCLFGWRTKL
jgi:hypothetical protein